MREVRFPYETSASHLKSQIKVAEILILLMFSLHKTFVHVTRVYGRLRRPTRGLRRTARFARLHPPPLVTLAPSP